MQLLTSAVYAQVAPENIDFLNKIMEAWGHVGIVSTLDAHQGLIIVRVTPDTQALAEQILLHMPFALQILPPL